MNTEERVKVDLLRRNKRYGKWSPTSLSFTVQLSKEEIKKNGIPNQVIKDQVEIMFFKRPAFISVQKIKIL